MKATATISGVHVEIEGNPEECWQFFKKETGFNEILGKISDGSKRLAELQMAATMPRLAIKYGQSAVEEIVKDMAPKKVCDPLARHTGNCGAEDCPIIKPTESLTAYQWRLGI